MPLLAAGAWKEIAPSQSLKNTTRGYVYLGTGQRRIQTQKLHNAQRTESKPGTSFHTTMILPRRRSQRRRQHPSSLDDLKTYRYSSRQCRLGKSSPLSYCCYCLLLPAIVCWSLFSTVQPMPDLSWKDTETESHHLTGAINNHQSLNSNQFKQPETQSNKSLSLPADTMPIFKEVLRAPVPFASDEEEALSMVR